MSAHQRRKGADGEREVVQAFIAGGFFARRGAPMQASSGIGLPDVDVSGLWIECKIGKAPNIRAAFSQACHDALTTNRLPIAATRVDRGEWLATLRLVDLIDLLREIKQLRAAAKL